jgi:hypothetical protein
LAILILLTALKGQFDLITRFTKQWVARFSDRLKGNSKCQQSIGWPRTTHCGEPRPVSGTLGLSAGRRRRCADSGPDHSPPAVRILPLNVGLCLSPDFAAAKLPEGKHEAHLGLASAGARQRVWNFGPAAAATVEATMRNGVCEPHRIELLRCAAGGTLPPNVGGYCQQRGIEGEVGD